MTTLLKKAFNQSLIKSIPKVLVDSIAKIASGVYQNMVRALPRHGRLLTLETDLPLQLRQWQDGSNHQRRHGSLNQAPWQHWLQLAEITSN